MMPNSDLKVLGEKVRKERKLAGLTQEQLAERCHVSTKHIANIDRHKPHMISGGHKHEVRCKSLSFQHGHRLSGTAAPGWENNLH